MTSKLDNSKKSLSPSLLAETPFGIEQNELATFISASLWQLLALVTTAVYNPSSDIIIEVPWPINSLL